MLEDPNQNTGGMLTLARTRSFVTNKKHPPTYLLLGICLKTTCLLLNELKSDFINQEIIYLGLNNVRGRLVTTGSDW